MRKLSIAIAMLVAVPTAFAAPIMLPHVMLRKEVVSRTGRHMVPPRVYTARERAIAVKRALGLNALPPLEGSVSLGPNKLLVPHVAVMELWHAEAVYADPPFHWPRANPVWVANLALINDPGLEPAEKVVMAIFVQGAAGKHYVFDCRTNSTPIPLIFAAKLNRKSGIGGPTVVHQGADGHFIFATNALPRNGTVSVDVTPKRPESGFSAEALGLYGCEISTF